MQPSPSGILRGHWSTEERTLKLWLTLELRLLVEGEQNVESLMSCNMGSSTLWTKESLAGRQAWRKLSSQSVCTHKHGSHLTLCAHFWLSPCRIPGTNLWSWMPTCEPLTCSHVAIDVWQTMFHFCLSFLSRRQRLCGLKPSEDTAWHRTLAHQRNTGLLSESCQKPLRTGSSVAVEQSSTLWPMQEISEASVFQKNDQRS